MKKYILGGVLILLLGGYALWSASRSQAPAPVSTTSTPSETTNPGTINGKYKDGAYTGSVGSAAPYGNVQVSVVISGGNIASVNVLKMPNGPGYTDELSAATFPKLVQQALTIQSAKVDIISGATQNSEGFQQSLAAALATAQN
ncbi:MAG: FMN-binding protein [Candidatus Adlerbacteria bacterium]